eukprot:4027387-Lingulodinium_polyedra.AAC.1
MVGSQEPHPRRLIGPLGVYVDRFLFVESDDPEWKALMNSVRILYAWGQHEYHDLALRGVRYRHPHDWTIT